MHHVHGFWHVADQRSAKHEWIIGNLCWVVQTRVISTKKSYQLFRVSQYLRGWISYFGIASGYQHCVEQDHWIRRRVRMAYWRQWCERPNLCALLTFVFNVITGNFNELLINKLIEVILYCYFITLNRHMRSYMIPKARYFFRPLVFRFRGQ